MWCVDQWDTCGRRISEEGCGAESTITAAAYARGELVKTVLDSVFLGVVGSGDGDGRWGLRRRHHFFTFVLQHPWWFGFEALIATLI